MKTWCGKCGKECEVVEEHSGPYPATSPRRTELRETISISSKCCDAQVYDDAHLNNLADQFQWAMQEMIGAYFYGQN